MNEALDIIIEKKADTLLGMKEVEVSRKFINVLDYNGGLSLFYDEIKNMSTFRRQDQLPEYTMNGCVYVAKWEYFKRNHLFHSINSVPYIMPYEKSVEIDSFIDLEFARFLVTNSVIDLKEWDE